MTKGHADRMRQSSMLWIGAAATIWFNAAAAMLQSEALTLAALAITGMFALVGVGFGIWAGRLLARDHARPESR